MQTVSADGDKPQQQTGTAIYIGRHRDNGPNHPQPVGYRTRDGQIWHPSDIEIVFVDHEPRHAAGYDDYVIEHRNGGTYVRYLHPAADAPTEQTGDIR